MVWEGAGLLIGDCRLGVARCLLGLWFRCSGYGSMVVRGFCFVKFGAGGCSGRTGAGIPAWIPAFAGMTWEGAGMVWEGKCGNDGDRGGG